MPIGAADCGALARQTMEQPAGLSHKFGQAGSESQCRPLDCGKLPTVGGGRAGVDGCRPGPGPNLPPPPVAARKSPARPVARLMAGGQGKAPAAGSD